MNPFWTRETYRKSVESAARAVVGAKALKGRHVLVTGAGGLVGSFVTDVLAACDAVVSVAGRNQESLHTRFPEAQVLYYNLEEDIAFSQPFDYIIHGAGYGHPAAFREDPAGVLLNSVNGTSRLLQYAAEHHVKRFLLVSSGEVYGHVDSMTARACYPVGKQAAETMCAAYYEKSGLDTVSARLCHTFGPGFSESDNRAATQFLRHALRGEDIVLKSRGGQRRSWLYAADSASAILSVLAAGESGKACDIASKDCVATIAELAGIMAEAAGVTVRYEIPDETAVKEQSPIAEQVLDAGALARLGWKAVYTLRTGVEAALRDCGK